MQSSTKVTSSQRYSEDEDFGTAYRPKSTAKSVIIQRASSGGRNRSSLYGGGMGGGMSSQRMSMSFNPAVYSQMAGTGIAGFRDTREKEKKEMQECNERLATYIEKVRWLEAQNKKLEAELEALRNRKQEDWRPIRDQYESELKQARDVIAELSTQKGISEAKLAGLQDEIQSLREMVVTHENNAKSYHKKIDSLNSQIGEFEGELTTLRLRVGSLEDELAKNRIIMERLKDENVRLRTDLDAETAAHIEQEVLAQTKTEEVEFLQELLDKLQLIQQEPVKVKGVDMETFFKCELRQAVSGIQHVYDEKVDQLYMEMDSKYATQVNQMKSGNVRDTMEAEHAKSEMKRLREQLKERSSRLAELEAAVASMSAERSEMVARFSELEMELETVRNDLTKKLNDALGQVEAMMVQINQLIDAKMSLELEIACYKRLLEGEENRSGLRQLVEQTIGVRGGGASQLADMIGQSSMGVGGGFGGQSASSTARFTVQRSSKGAVGFQSADASGANIVIENTNRTKNMSMRGWRMSKKANGKDVCDVPLPEELKAGQILTLFAKGAKSKPSNDNEQIVDVFSFGVGQCEVMLHDDQNQEKARLTMKETH